MRVAEDQSEKSRMECSLVNILPSLWHEIVQPLAAVHSAAVWCRFKMGFRRVLKCANMGTLESEDGA